MAKVERRSRRAGLTLAELLIASAIMVMVAGVLAALGQAVRNTWDYSQGRADATQHARVAIERITRAVGEAHAVAEHPGFAVLRGVQGSDEFPDTLVVWQPAGGTPANADGPPLISECVFFCPDPKSPNCLLEITAPLDNRPISLDDAQLNTAAWRSKIEALKNDNGSQRTVLTDLLRVANAAGAATTYEVDLDSDPMDVAKLKGSVTNLRGAVRFEQRLRPTAADWQNYLDLDDPTWDELVWAQSIHGPQTGLRQSWLRVELQLVPGEAVLVNDTEGVKAVPFFGSAEVYYELHHK